MRNKTQFLKRVTALFLSLLMMLSPTVNSFAAVVHEHGHELSDPSDAPVGDGKWHGTTGELISVNYDLTEVEKAFLACSALVGETYAVEIPTDDKNPDLVTVDAEKQTVTALPYEVDGQVWVPTKAVLKYNGLDGTPGPDSEVVLTQNGEAYVGSFRKPANSYRVEVTYSLFIAVEAELQKLLLNAPYDLVDGYKKVNDVADGSVAIVVGYLNDLMEDLRSLYNGVSYEVVYGDKKFSYTLGLDDDSELKEAIRMLLDDYGQNNGKLTLLVDFEEYLSSESKVQYMMEKGEDLRDDLGAFNQLIQTVNANTHEILELSNKLEHLAKEDGTDTINGMLAEAEGLFEETIQNGLDQLTGQLETAINKVYTDNKDSVFNWFNDAIDELIAGDKTGTDDGEPADFSITFPGLNVEFEGLDQSFNIEEKTFFVNFYNDILPMLEKESGKNFKDYPTVWNMIEEMKAQLSGLEEALADAGISALLERDLSFDILADATRTSTPTLLQALVGDENGKVICKNDKDEDEERNSVIAEYIGIIYDIDYYISFISAWNPDSAAIDILKDALKKAEDVLDLLDGKLKKDENGVFVRDGENHLVMDETKKNPNGLRWVIEDIYNLCTEDEISPYLKEYLTSTAWDYAVEKIKKMGATAQENPAEGENQSKKEIFRSKAEAWAREKAEPALNTVKEKLEELRGLAREKATELREIVEGDGTSGATTISRVATVVRSAYNTTPSWSFLGKAFLKSGITLEEYKALDTLAKSGIDIYDQYQVNAFTGEPKEKLLAHETVLSGLVSQSMVTVKVDALVVPSSAIDSADLIPLTEYTTSFAMDIGSSAESILEKIGESGIQNEALSQWDPFYHVGAEFYHCTLTVLDKEGNPVENVTSLTEDLTYIIEYTPKNLTITEQYEEGEQNVSVPYGYNYTLVRPTDPAKSFDYKVNGVSYREGTVIRVVEDIIATRTEGKAIAGKTLAELIIASATPGVLLTQEEKDVLASGAFLVDTLYFRTPDSNDQLTKVEKGYKLEAKTMIAGLLDSEAKWIPVSAFPVFADGVGAEFSLSQNGDVYEGTFSSDEEIIKVQVTYQLSIENLSSDTVSALVNIANTLVKETEKQKKELDDLCNEKNFYNNLGMLTTTILNTLNSLSGIGEEAKVALNILNARCMNEETGYSYLYEYLGKYLDTGINGGLAYYYTGDNAKKLKEQIDLINEHLNTVWTDDKVQTEVNKSFADQAGKVESVIEMLRGISLTPVNPLVNTESSAITTLLAAVAAAKGATSEHAASSDVVLETVLSAAAPGQTTYGVTIQVLNKNGAVVNSYTDEAFGAQGATIDKAKFEQMYRELLQTVPNAKYYSETLHLPEENVVLGDTPALYTVTLSPVAYTVKIDGEADQLIYAFEAYTITLPGTGDSGHKYRYTIGNSTVEVLSGSIENFSLGVSIDEIDALFGDDRELIITRELIDINKEDLLEFVQDFNQAIVDAGLLSGNKLEVALIPVEEASGNLSIVLRISKGDADLTLDDILSEIIGLVTDLHYVGLNGSTFFGSNADHEMKIYLQTLVNFLMNSGISIETFINLFDENGDIKEMTLPGTAVGAVNGDIVVSPNGIINDVDAIGGKLIESTMQFGISMQNSVSVPFYVTLQDFDQMADVFAKVKKGAEQILPYFNFSLDHGAVNVSVNAPDNAYAYLLTALLVTGQVSFDTLLTYDLAEVMDYFVGLIDPVFASGDISVQTFINTVEKTGFYDAIKGFDTEANRSLLDMVYNGTDHAYDAINLTGSSVGGLYEGVLNYNSLDVILNQRPSMAEFKDLIAEINSGVKLPVTFHLKNRDAAYQALVFDIGANGIANKYHITENAASAIAKAGNNSVVVLLSDIRGNVTVNSNNVILNLNGHTINGDITAKGSVVIVDSTLSTTECGTVTGELKVDGGAFLIGAGKYVADVSDYLKLGFAQENGVVTNGFYKLQKNGDNLDLFLGSDSFAVNKTSAKVLAADLVAKLVMNFYTCSELLIDGNRIYGANLLNVTESLDTLSVLVGKIVDCVSLEGSSAFATDLLQKVTDFAAISDAIRNGESVISYTLTQSAFNPHMTYEGSGEDGYFAINLTSADEKKHTKLNVFVGEDVLQGHKDIACNILDELANITTFHQLYVAFTDASYSGSEGFSIEGGAAVDVEFDLTENVNYPIVLAAILAKNAPGARRTELVDAIYDYQKSANTAPLKNALEEATAKEIIEALKATRSMTFSSILASIGVVADEAVELESIYAIARKLMGYAADLVDVTGPNAKLAGLKVDGQYGVYGGSLKKGEVSAKLILKVFTEEKAIVVKNAEGNVVLNTDDLVLALETVKDGETIYVNKTVTLAEDVVLPAVSFALVKAENIDFDGKKIWFENGNTVLTADQDISDHLTSDSAIFCSEVEEEKKDGLFIYSLQGDAHVWVNIPAVEPECEKPGSTAAVQCSLCQKYLDGKKPETIPALRHDYIAFVTDATCTTDGFTTYTCSICNDSYTGNIVPALNHEGFLEKIPAVDKTCTTDGSTEGLKCTKCGEILVAPQVVPASHNPVKADKDPTCTEPGISGKTVCHDCGETLEEGTVIPASGHGVAVTQGKEPTCTEPGLTAGAHCPYCDYVWVPQELRPALSHQMVTLAAVPATCTQTGLTEGAYCKRCDEVLVEQEETPKIPHTEETIPGKDATCSATGLTEGKKCSVCGEITAAQVETPMIPHEVEIRLGIDPTCSSEGYSYIKVCSVCGELLEALGKLDKLPHTPEVIPAVPATCTSTGLTEGKKCSVCGEILEAQEVTPKIAHTPETIEGREPTCSSIGFSSGEVCKVCGKLLSYQNVIGKLPHTPEVIPAKAATCTATGLTEGSKCGKCNTILVEQEETPIVAHTPVTIPGREPTCTSIGFSSGEKCSVCNVLLTAQDIREKLPHTPETVPAVPATCTSTGLTEGSKCKDCDKILVEQEETPKIAHTPETIPGREPTCTSIGFSSGEKCSVCDKLLSVQNAVPKLDHTPVSIPAKAATCTATGLTEGSKCGVCNTLLVEQQETPIIDHTHVPIPGQEATCTSYGYTEGEMCSECGKIFKQRDVIPKKEHTPEVMKGYPATTETEGKTDGEKCNVCGTILVSQTVLKKIPSVDLETVNVEPEKGIIRGAKVDEEQKALQLDASPLGLKASEISEVTFAIDNAIDTKVTVWGNGGTVERQGDAPICNGDVVEVWAINEDGEEVTLTYTITIMGDPNCDGKVNVRDLVTIDFYIIDELVLEGAALAAADMNNDGKINVRDAVVSEVKIVDWSTNEYVSQTR